MNKSFFIATLLVAIFFQQYSCQVSEYGQCGGDGYSGSRTCSGGLTCYKQHQWYSQCLRSCPSGWDCTAESSSSATTVKSNVEAQLYGQCGGDGYSGPTTCPSGSSCYFQTQWYAQCLYSCPAGWQCSLSSGSTTSGSVVTSTTTTQAQTTASTTTSPIITAITTMGNSNSFPSCRFRFGAAYNGDNYDYSPVDYMTIWIGSPSSTHGTNFNPWWHGAMLNAAIKYKKMPVYYGYIIAFMARDEWGLQDCDVGYPSLCEKGSDFIRARRDAIVAKYKHYAAETAKMIGSGTEMIWLIEPDFWQYYGDTHQLNGPLSGPYMRKLYDDIALAIKSEMPNSKISFDISAWLSQSAMATWWGFFASSAHVNYLHTSGGQSKANSANIKPNELTWAFMSTLTGRKIIADTGYGVAGGSQGHVNEWDDVTNLVNRIRDGVISVTQANPKYGWASTLAQVRAALPNLC